MNIGEGRFSYRRNEHGTYDSICMRCFRTVARRYTENDLREDERAHICEYWLIPSSNGDNSQNV